MEIKRIIITKDMILELTRTGRATCSFVIERKDKYPYELELPIEEKK